MEVSENPLFVLSGPVPGSSFWVLRAKCPISLINRGNRQGENPLGYGC
jgi:hypothetical protein